MRLIDADVLKYALGCSDEAMRFDAMIDEMPTINPSPDWTPCAQGLPESEKDKNECDVTIEKDCNGGRKRITMRGMLKNGKWYGTDGAWNIETSGIYGTNAKVIAWQPLPAPYNPDRKEDAKSDDVSQWPDWKKRAATCNYEFGKDD